MNFWTGVIIGAFVGANIGIVVTGILAGSKRSGYEDIFQLVQYPMDEAVIDDAAPAGRIRSSLDRLHPGIGQPRSQGLQSY